MFQAPPGSGLFFYDYKGHHSVNLSAFAEAGKKFIMVDIGVAWRQSDGRVFNHSEIGKRLKRKEMNLVPPELLVPGGVNLPYVFLYDEAFSLSDFMIRPYPRSSDLTPKKKVYNYRHSRACRIGECSFGTLAAVSWVFRSPMKTLLPVTIEVIKASVCLHNFLIMFEPKRQRHEREAIEPGGMLGLPPLLANTIRENFADFFMNEEKVYFHRTRQWTMIYKIFYHSNIYMLNFNTYRNY